MTSPTPSPCTCFRLRRLSRLVSQRYDRALAPAGINVNQYSILRRADRGPRGIGELARELGMDRTTLTRDLRPLAAAGWIDEVAPADGDARRRCVATTDAGRRVLAVARPLWRRAQDALDAAAGDGGIDALHARLDALLLRIERPEQAGTP